MLLAEIKEGDSCIILDIEKDRGTKQLLLVNGFFVGSKLTVNTNDSFRDLLYITVSNRFIAIRKSDARKIEVAKLEVE